MSTDRLPVGMPSIRRLLSAPRGMIEPSPNCFSIAATVLRSSVLFSSITSAGVRLPFLSPDVLEALSAFLPAALSFLATGILAAVVEATGLAVTVVLVELAAGFAKAAATMNRLLFRSEERRV